MPRDHRVLAFAITLLAALTPAAAQAQLDSESALGPVPDPPSALGAPGRLQVDPAFVLDDQMEEPDFGYRRAVRLYGFASALTTLALAGVGVGVATWDSCSSSSWFCINPGPLFMAAGAIVGVHGLILFILASVTNAKARRREAAFRDDRAPRVAVDVRMGGSDAGLVLSGSF